MMGFSLERSWVVLLWFVAGCALHDDEASVNLPQEPIAAGAFYPLDVSDACRGGGKANFCSSEAVVSVDSFTVDTPRIANLLRMEDLDAASRLDTAELVVDAKEPGTTSISIEATFDDDSQRKLEAELVVARADRLEISHSCSIDEPDDRELFPAGHEVALRLRLLHASQELKGELRESLLEGEGLRRESGHLIQNKYVWTAPAASEATRLSSPAFPKFAATYRSYALEDVAIEQVTRKHDGPTRHKSFVALAAVVSVAGKRPCELPPFRLESLTPEICAGRDGEVSWIEDNPAYGVGVRGLASGMCELTVGIVGSDVSVPVELPLEVTDIPVTPVDPCQGVSCEPVSSCADGSELALRGCCATCVPVPNRMQCEEQRVAWDALYETELEAATSCNVDADCTYTVLSGGCRRYCFVPLNGYELVDFMNTISEDYYTGCPSCEVDSPAPCGDGKQPFCDAGHCRLREIMR